MLDADARAVAAQAGRRAPAWRWELENVDRNRKQFQPIAGSGGGFFVSHRLRGKRTT